MGNMSRQIQFGIMAVVLYVLADDFLGSLLVNVILYVCGTFCLYMSFRYAESGGVSRSE